MTIGTTSSKVEVRNTELYGRVLYALQDFEVGQEVFVEQPLLLSFSKVSLQEEMLLRRVSEKCGIDLFDDFIFLKSFCEAPADTQSLVLDCYSPPQSAIDQSVLLKGLMKAVDVARTYNWSLKYEKEILQKVVLVKACNAHAYYSQSSSSAALYSLGSKLRHSCLPNVVYTSRRRNDGKGSFVAHSRISAGDELFISYISVFQSTPMRNSELMENYLFVCNCPLCTTGFDRFRVLPCANCSSRDTARFNQDTQVWNCANCGPATVVDCEEENFLVQDGKSFLRSFQANIPNLLEKKFKHLQSRMPQHAITKLVKKTWLEKSLHSLDVSTVEASTEDILNWCGGSVDFLDSSLVEIACVLGRAGRFESALRFLNLVKKDMEFLYGGSSSNSSNDEQDLVNRAIRGCLSRKSTLVPVVQQEQQGGCPMQ